MRADSRVHRSRAAMMAAVAMKAKKTPIAKPSPTFAGSEYVAARSYSSQMQPATTAICSTMNASVFTMPRSISHA